MCKATLQSSKALRSVNVVNFGAVGNGNADDSNAFTKASEAACGATGEASLTVPAQKTFLLKPVKFLGPCKSSQINILVQGNIVAPSKIYQNGQHLIWVPGLCLQE
ncbi:probable polygalacturonase At3g15720 [Jatropha curcas]|uniref:probable polygalacturonase At3g15720 n=1 Tax=Jatropha curcas TaxID=180498 RepID=UPI001894DB88|nr:probable polygalacturonase At3g15720 [Jatropha curcas]